jgi:hypothetical protein
MKPTRPSAAASERGRSSRRKGARGELAARSVLEDLTGVEGWERSARQQRRKGGDEVPDLVHPDRPRLHPEVKVGRAPPVLPGLDQAIEDASPAAVPFVLAKKSDGSGRWVLVVEAARFWELVEALRSDQG